MIEYKEYNWEEGSTNGHSYLFLTLLSILNKLKKGKILDIGCGNGAIACELLSRGFDVYGLDASEVGISIANKVYPNRFFVQNISSETLPNIFSTFKFDIIISTEVIEHIYAPRSYMKLIEKSINSNGHLIISTPYHGYIKNLAMALSNTLDQHFTVLWDGGHIKFWSVKTITSLLKEFGFDVIQFKGSGRIPYMWKSMFIVAKRLD